MENLSKRINVGYEQNVQIHVTKNPSNLKISLDPGKNPKFNKRRAFNNAVGPGKNSKIINAGPKFIPDYRVSKNLPKFVYSKLILHSRSLQVSNLKGWPINVEFEEKKLLIKT